jgi:hypothetical protein
MRYAGGVKRIQEVHDAGEDAALLAIRPVPETARGCSAENSVIEFPKQLALSRIDGDDFLGWRIGVKGMADDDGTGLQDAFLAGVELLSHTQVREHSCD